MLPFAMMSAIVSPNPEHRLVLVTETKDIVPLATSSMALRTVHVYAHLLCPFLNEPKEIWVESSFPCLVVRQACDWFAPPPTPGEKRRIVDNLPLTFIASSFVNDDESSIS